MSIGFENFLSGMNATLLWENPNPNNAIGTTTISCENLTDYDWIYVETKETTTNDRRYHSFCEVKFDAFFSNTYRTNAITSIYIQGDSVITTGRWLWFGANKNEINFGTNTTLGLSDTNNTRNIPLKIYGLKGKVLGVRGGVILKLLHYLTRKWGV